VRSLLLLLCFQSALAASDPPQTNSPAPAGDFSAFRIIPERNIFNPNRSARGSRNGDDDAPRPARSETISLVGTMLYGDKQFAFFDSSSSTYKKVLKAGEAIAGYEVKEVAASGVTLDLKGEAVKMAVGQLLRREGEGEWKVGGQPAGETNVSAGTSNTAGASSSEEEDEAVKRLMKKREEEMNR
jgi:hypothetical protein